MKWGLTRRNSTFKKKSLLINHQSLNWNYHLMRITASTLWMPTKQIHSLWGKLALCYPRTPTHARTHKRSWARISHRFQSVELSNKRHFSDSRFRFWCQLYIVIQVTDSMTTTQWVLKKLPSESKQQATISEWYIVFGIPIWSSVRHLQT